MRLVQDGDLARPNGHRVAYCKREGGDPPIVFLGGFNSSMFATKPEAIDAWAADRGRQFVRFDYFGHGRSSGAFVDGTVTQWLGDALGVIDGLTAGSVVLVGSSMGAWLALLTALKRPERVCGLLLIAPAIDFTEALLWQALDPAAREQIMQDGQWMQPSLYSAEPYPVGRALIEDGRSYLLLNAPIKPRAPVRIIQGMVDPDVPWRHAMRLVEQIDGDVQITLVKDGDHRLSKPHEILLILQVLATLCGTIGYETA